jgi:hypothetical protein
MAPPKKRPPQGKPGQKRPPQGRKPNQARKPATSASKPAAKPDTPQDEAKAESVSASDAAAEAAAESGGAPLSKAAEERKAKREAARQERIAAARKRQQAKRRKQIAIGVVVLVVLVGGTIFSINKARGDRQALAAAVEEAGCGDIESFDDEGQEHLDQNENYEDYETNPPTSGPHRVQPAPWGSYREAPEPETLVHNLEHGGIVIHYKDLSDEQVDRVDEFADSYVDGVIAAPNPDIETPIALAAWRHSQGCEELNTTVIEGFIRDRCNKGPEKVGTTCAKE